MKLKITGGQRFGRLVVIRELKTLKRQGIHRYALMECDCGKKKRVRIDLLFSKNTSSCGCLQKWNPVRSIKRLDHAIQREINLMNKYQSTFEEWQEVFQWLEKRTQELNKVKYFGADGPEMGLIQACSNPAGG